MSQTESELQIVERGEGWFKVQHRQEGNTTIIEDTFAGMYHHNETAHSVLEKLPLFLQCLCWVFVFDKDKKRAH